MTVQHLVDLGVTDHYADALHKVIAAKVERSEPAPADGEEKAAATGRRPPGGYGSVRGQG
ncbi:hypothetical protein [Streptomyces wedmorensis]